MVGDFYFGLLVGGQVFCFQGSPKFTSAMLIHVAEVNMSSHCDVVRRSAQESCDWTTGVRFILPTKLENVASMNGRYPMISDLLMVSQSFLQRTVFSIIPSLRWEDDSN